MANGFDDRIKVDLSNANNKTRDYKEEYLMRNIRNDAFKIHDFIFEFERENPSLKEDPNSTSKANNYFYTLGTSIDYIKDGKLDMSYDKLLDDYSLDFEVLYEAVNKVEQLNMKPDKDSAKGLYSELQTYVENAIEKQKEDKDKGMGE